MTDQHLLRVLEPFGLLSLGSLAVNPADGIPDLEDGQAAGKLLMIGNGGSSFWEAFSHSSEYRDGGSDPLDRWSRRVGEQVAGELGAGVIFPFAGPPYFPFQSWAKRTGQVVRSPILMLLHSRYGLWHAYRFALVLPGAPGPDKPAAIFNSPCADCTDQPCLTACPVAAFSAGTYRVGDCVAYLAGNRESACRTSACAARRACPVAQQFTYLPQQAQFHMDAFVKSQSLQD